MEVENELGVIVLFSQEAKQAGYEITNISATFPDATIRYQGIDFQTEFEFLSSNFVAHNHDERKCDLIICFQDDAGDFAIPVLVLSDPNWKTMEIKKADDINKELSFWKRKALQEKRRSNALQKELDESRNKKKLYNLSTMDKLEEFYKDNPNATQTDAAQAVGVSRQRVSQLLKEIRTIGASQNGHVESVS